MGVKRSFTGQSFWSHGYFVFTMGLDGETTDEYIRIQKTDKEIDQLTISYTKKISPIGIRESVPLIGFQNKWSPA